MTFGLWSYDGDWSGPLAAGISRGLAQDADAMAESLSGDEPSMWDPSTGPTCESIHGERMPYSPGQEAQGIVGDWLVKRAGHYREEFSSALCVSSREITDRFAALDPAEREAWLGENLAELRAGKLTLEDLP